MSDPSLSASSHLTIGYDGRVFLHDRITGVERYARELYAALRTFVNVSLFQPRSHNRYLQHGWTQTGLLKAALGGRIQALFCPVTTAPLLLPKSIPLVVTIHDVAFLRYPDLYSTAFREYYRLMLPLIAKRADRIITISESARRDVEAYLPATIGKTAVVHHGLGSGFSPCGARREPFILGVASLNRHKNLPVLLRAYKQIYKTTGYRLILVGSDRPVLSDDREAAQLIAEMPPGIVSRTGYISETDLVNLYRRAALFVFPSLYEGFGWPPLEAMACGCPVLLSALPVFKETCGDAAEYFDPADADALAAKACAILSSQERADTLVQRGLQNAAQYSWNRCARQSLEILMTSL